MRSLTRQLSPNVLDANSGRALITRHMAGQLIRPQQFDGRQIEKRMDELARRYHETQDRKKNWNL
jgi:hypothetical protein